MVTGLYPLFGQSFVEVHSALPNVNYGAVDWGDFDHDGDLDLLIAGSTTSNVLTRIYRNDGGGNFSDIRANLPGVVALGGGAQWADFDGDGDLDVFLSGITGSPLSEIFRNDGQGIFTRINAGLAQADVSSAAWGDFDNDGDLDLFESGQNQFGDLLGGLYRNDGNGVFRSMATSIPVVAYGSVCWGDHDHDGDLDLLMGGMSRDGAICRVYRNEGQGLFSDIRAQLPYLDNGNADWGDFDNDGHPDILLSGSLGGTHVYRNNQLGGFVQSGGNLVDGYNCWAAWGDYDNDGLLDFVVEGVPNGAPAFLLAYRNTGTATFSPTNFFGTGQHAGQVAWADYDGDGKLDFVATGLDDLGNRRTRLFRGVTAKRNTRPTPPADLRAAVDANGVNLNWSTASDPDQPAGLTYNVRVGRSPGLGNVMTPHATATGFRQKAGFGNAGQSGGWRLTNLTAGVYYWSVQAIDHAFAGSPFAREQTFTVTNVLNTPTNDAPFAPDQKVTTTEDASLALTLRAIDVDSPALTYTVTMPPSHGSLSGAPPNLTYTPAANYFGEDSFIFKANDGQLDSPPAVVTITILPVNDRPVAKDRHIFVTQNGSAPVRLLAQDIDTPESDLIYEVLSGPSHGTLSGTGANLRYTPSLDYLGPDTFQYIATDIGEGALSSQPANVRLSVRPVGRVVAWGNNDGGQLDVPVPLTSAVAVGAGVYHSLAATEQGIAFDWPVKLETRIPAGLSNVVAVAGGFYHSIALKSDGTVVGWGVAQNGETNIPPDLTDVVAISAGSLHNLALKADGTVVSWGWNGHGQTNVPAGLSNVVAVAAGAYHSLAVTTEGRVLAWGRNESGQTNVPSGLSSVMAVAGGAAHSLALKTDGTVTGWGLNQYGQTSIPLGLNEVVAISSGAGHSLALRQNGTVVGWGDNRENQTNVPPHLPYTYAIAAGFNHNVALVAKNIAPTADATATVRLVLSVNASNAVVVLDGSRSTDPDGDALQYFWFAAGGATPIATGVVSAVTLPVGTNSISLRVSDGIAQGEQTISVEVITTTEAVNRLIQVMEQDVEIRQALVATLSAALRAIDRSNPTAAIHQLEIFQNKVRLQLAPLDPVLAARLIQDAQDIIDALGGVPSPVRIVALDRLAKGITRLEFSAMDGPIYVVEASTNMVTWEAIGVAATCPGGHFEFKDGASMAGRFYRVVVVP